MKNLFLLLCISFLSPFCHARLTSDFTWTQIIGPPQKYSSTLGGRIYTNQETGTTWMTGTTNKSVFNPTVGKLDYYITSFDNNGQFICGSQNGGEYSAGMDTVQPFGIKMDHERNYIYISGIIVDGQFENQTQTGVSDYFLSKYDPSNCSLIWVRQFGQQALELEVAMLSIDLQNNLFITTTYGKTTILLNKHTSTTGDLIWRKNITQEKISNMRPQGITIDKEGNIYITGFAESLSYPFRMIYFVMKLDANGELVWSQLGPQGNLSEVTTNDIINDDINGYIYITGATNIGLWNQTQVGLQDYFIVCYDSNSNLIWSRQNAAVKGNAEGLSLQFDSLTNTLYLAGSTDTSLIPQQPLIGYTDIFYAQYDIKGNLLIIQEYGFPHYRSWVYGMGIDNNNGKHFGGMILGIDSDDQYTQGWLTKA